MDKLNITYKFPPNIISGSAEDKTEFLNQLSTLNISDNAELQAIFGEGLISQDMFVTFDAADHSMTKSLLVTDCSDELLTATQNRFTELLTYFPNYNGGELIVNVEKNVAPDLEQSLINLTATINPHNNLLPYNDLFSTFEELHFYVDTTGVYVKTDSTVEKYYNNGRILVLGNINKTSWYNYKSVYGRLTASSIRLIAPSVHLSYNDSYYSEFKNSTNEVGIPYIVDALDTNIINEDYFNTFIDQIKELINAGKHINVYPTEVIKLESRLRDSLGYYFKYIKFEFNNTNIDLFVENQITYLDGILTMFPQITDKESIINYARSQWLLQ